MRQNVWAASLLAILCILGNGTAAFTLPRRQESTTATTAGGQHSTRTTSSDVSTTTAPPPTAATKLDSSNRETFPTTDSVPTVESLATSSDLVPRPTTTPNEALAATATTSTTATSATATATARPLPIKPVITPAFGIVGVILIVAGAALCLIGVKHQWLHIFLSTALLTGLAVTVLVLYVMKPPVSDALQGVYMVAAVLTGLIFGALALVFKEVADGLGCLLGGFCLAMWFLGLSPGGLISSVTGRAILIAVFCVAFFGLYFSQYTRTYGLILGTTFAGSQIAIVGMDCISRAGLKEFWLYLWGLNDDAFPIDTSTYPITRGIKVETACTIILFLFGIISQIKLWNIVKARRARKDADRYREDANRDALEAAAGLNIEYINQRDRVHWEAVYGDKKAARVQVDGAVNPSVVSIAQRRSAGAKAGESYGHELAHMAGTHRLSFGAVGICDDAVDRNLVSQAASCSSERSRLASATDASADPTRGSSERPKIANGPEVVPLPFTIPGETSGTRRSPDHESSSSSLAGIEQPAGKGRDISLERCLLNPMKYGDGLDDDDRASSVAATADEDLNDYQLSLPHEVAIHSLEQQLELNTDGALTPPGDDRTRPCSPDPAATDCPLDEDDDEAVVRSVTAFAEPTSSPFKTRSERQSRRSTSSSQIPAKARLSIDSASLNGAVETAGKAEGLQDHLTQRFSKVALTYRTNEWAKHISEADEPALEDECESHSPGVRVDRAFAEEAARPVDIEALTPVEAHAAQAVSELHSTNPHRRNLHYSSNTTSRTTSGAATPVYAFHPNSPAVLPDRQNSSATSVRQPKLTLRKSSTPMTSEPLVESPVEDAYAAEMGSTYNLMGERRYRLKRKPTGTSFNALASFKSDLNVIAPSDSASMRKMSLEGPDGDDISLLDRKQLIDEENMTLAERKSMMQMQVQAALPDASTGRSRFRQSGLPNPVGPGYRANDVYDSHQPKRSNTVNASKNATKFMNWRQSLQQDATAKRPLLPAMDEEARQNMMSERHRSQQEQQRQSIERARRESLMEQAMRSGQFHGAHREAMQRLQAQANTRRV